MEKYLTELINVWGSGDSPSYSFKRFRNLVNQDPEKILDALYFKIYQNHPGLSTFSMLRSFVIPQAPIFANCCVLYIRHLRDKYRTSGFAFDPDSLVLREVRYLYREIVLLALNDPATSCQSRHDLLHALRDLHLDPKVYEGVPCCPDEVINNLPRYLKGADLLAELTEFIPIIFTNDELCMFANSLPAYRFTQDDEKVLETVLVPVRKKHILQVLHHFILNYPMESYVKKGFAIYISLGEIVPWAKHSFIRRLLAVGYQEARVLACATKK